MRFLLYNFYFIFYPEFITGKNIGGIYKHCQYQLSKLVIKEPIISYIAYQESSYIEITITSVSYDIDKEKYNYIFCSQNTIHNYLNITNNDNIQSCERPKKDIAFQPLQLQIIIHNV